MKTSPVVAIALVVLAASSGAQAPKDPAFDVAAIKPAADTQAFSFSMVQPGGRYIGQNMNLRLLIKTAYGVHDSQIVGGPSWIDSDRWDINAKAEGSYKDATTFRDTARLMVRPLLTDRFKLTFHHEQRELPVYALVLTKPNEFGPQFRRDDNCDPGNITWQLPAAEGAAEPAGPMACGGEQFNPRHLRARGSPLTYMLVALGRTNLDRPIVDHTGLTGKFDWEVQWVPEDLRVDGASRPEGPGIFQAFRDQLGLKLEPMRDRVDVLVIDHAERPQTD